MDPGLHVTARAEALLYAAARAQLVEEAIEPLLAAGAWVLLDRFVDSSLAYQGGGRELGIDAVRAINEFAIRTACAGPDAAADDRPAPRARAARARAREPSTASSASATTSSSEPRPPTSSWRDRSPSGSARSTPPSRPTSFWPRRSTSSRICFPRDLLGVTRRVGLRERPGVAHHLLEPRLVRLPAELRSDPVAGRDQHRRITGPARRLAAPESRGPVTARAAAITSRTENPFPLPRLKIRCSPWRAPSSASRCAAARSSMWM